MPSDGTPNDEGDASFTKEDVLEAAPMSRRRLISTLAAGGMAAAAGCSSDGGSTSTDTDTTTTTEPPLTTKSPGGGGGTPTDGTPAPGQTETTDTGGGGDGTDTQTKTAQPTTDIYSIMGAEVPIEQGHMNMWNTKTGWSPPWYSNPPVLNPEDFAIYLGGIAQTWKYINDEAGLNIGPFNEGFEYHDGAAFDPQIIWDQQKYLYEKSEMVATSTFNHSIFSYENLRMNGKKSMSMDFSVSGNPTITALNILNTEGRSGFTDTLKTHPELHSQFLKTGKQATSKSAITKMVSRLVNQYKIPYEKGVKQMGIKPGKLRTFNRNMVVSEYREPYASNKFPWGYGNENNPDANWWYRAEWGDKPKMAGIIAISFIEDMESVSRNVILNSAIAGKIDTISDVRDPTIVKQFPEGWRVVPGTPEEADAIVFSPKGLGQKSEKMKKRRKAIAYAVSPGEYSKVASVPTPSHKVSGIPYSGLERRWLGQPSEYNETYTNYGSAATGWTKKDKAKQLLRESGLRKRNGMWVEKGSGKPWQPTYVYFSGSAELAGAQHAQNVIEQLKRFGINVDSNNVSGSRMETLIVNEEAQANWDMASLASQFATVPHPWHGFHADCGLGGENLGPPIGSGTFRNGHSKVKVPPFGKPDGTPQTFNYDRKVRQLQEARDREKTRRLVKEIAWAINQWVPGVVMGTQADPNAINMNKFQAKVPLDHTAWNWGTSDLIELGVVDVNPKYNPSVTPIDSTEKQF